MVIINLFIDTENSISTLNNFITLVVKIGEAALYK